MTHNSDIENLIAKALTGEATPVELVTLEQWTASSPENEKYFNEMKNLLLISGEAKSQHIFDTDKAWNNLKHQMARQQMKGKVRELQPFNSSLMFRVAAMIIIIVGIIFGMYKIFSPRKFPTITIAAAATAEEHTLPDSTSVVLNRNSTIAYSFTDKARKVSLEGEAVFDLASDNARPFEVAAGGIVIHDIGTVFNVKSPLGSDSVVVLVLDGEVELSSGSNKMIVLKKGEEGLYVKSRDEFLKKAVSDTNAIAYKTKIFVFENASLEVVAQKLNEVYGIQIVLSEAIRLCKITVTFKNEKPETIMDVISGTLQLNMTRENNKIFLDGTACEE